MPDKDPAPLKALTDAIRRAVDADDVRNYLEADRSFHRAFVAAAGNELLTSAVSN